MKHFSNFPVFFHQFVEQFILSTFNLQTCEPDSCFNQEKDDGRDVHVWKQEGVNQRGPTQNAFLYLFSNSLHFSYVLICFLLNYSQINTKNIYSITFIHLELDVWSDAILEVFGYKHSNYQIKTNQLGLRNTLLAWGYKMIMVCVTINLHCSWFPGKPIISQEHKCCTYKT